MVGPFETDSVIVVPLNPRSRRSILGGDGPTRERTMNTYLGASAKLGPDDVDRDLVARAQVLYLEGYLWDEPEAKDAYRLAARTAHEVGNRVAFSLSDSFCVDRHRHEFLDLVESDVDVLFANEAEITSLYEVDDFDDALQHVQHHCEIAALTRSERGAVIVTRDEVHVVDATHGRRGRRHHRRRRPVRSGVPLRAHPRLRPRHRREARRARGR